MPAAGRGSNVISQTVHHASARLICHRTATGQTPHRRAPTTTKGTAAADPTGTAAQVPARHTGISIESSRHLWRLLVILSRRAAFYRTLLPGHGL